MNRFSQVSIAILLSLESASATARFGPNDADQIDPESTDMELFGDILSYRHPEHWEDLWESAQAGYRVSAGSFDIKRFFLSEDIKFNADRFGPLDFGFRGASREDLSEQVTDREASLALRLGSPLYLAIVGYSGTFKKLGDVGLALEWRDSIARNARVYWMSIEHYFNDKEDEPGSRYKRKAYEAGASAQWEFRPGTRLKTDWMWASPIRWERNSRRYTYEYWRRTLSAAVEQEISDKNTGFARTRLDQKFEQRLWDEYRTDAGDRLSKNLLRNQAWYEVGTRTMRSADEYVSLSAWTLLRDANFGGTIDELAPPTAVAPAAPESNPYPEESSFSVARREYGLSGVWQFPSHALGADAARLGGLLSRNTLATGGRQNRSFEAKPQAAVEYRLGKNGSLMLNTTWDFDELFGKWLLKGGRFPGWDGGNLQAQITF